MMLLLLAMQGCSCGADQTPKLLASGICITCSGWESLVGVKRPDEVTVSFVMIYFRDLG